MSDSIVVGWNKDGSVLPDSDPPTNGAAVDTIGDHGLDSLTSISRPGRPVGYTPLSTFKKYGSKKLA